MAVELKREAFKIAENFFIENKFQIPALTVINSKFPGKVYTDDVEKPEIVLVWALSRWSYLSCKEILPIHKNFIIDVFNNMIFPLLKELGEDYFEVYTDNNILWESILKESLKDCSINKHYENTFILNTEKFEKSDFSVNLSDDIVICENTLPVVPEVYNKYYECDKFEKNAFGMAVMKNGDIMSQCVNNGFVHDNRYFIDLDTFNNGERNKGYGTFIAYNLIHNLLKKGLLPVWETTVNNIPSQKVANKLGFEKIEEYPVYSIENF